MKSGVRFAVIGVNHGHIYGQTDLMIRAGAEFVGFHAPEPDLAKAYGEKYPGIPFIADKRTILDDPSIHIVVSAGIPGDRAHLGVEVMRSGKDYMTDKPGFTTLEQLAEVRKVQAETGRIYSICFSEHFEQRSTVKAAELVAAGAVGKVVQTVGLGPHQTKLPTRPDWFFKKARYGGILADIASHQCHQFLLFTGSTKAEVVASQVANWKHPQHPEFEDFGDLMLSGDGGTGYIRVDWYTPDGLGVWGDGRLTILGTEGYIELRKYIDIAGKPGADHLFLVDGKGTRHIDCSGVDLPYGRHLVQDILNRTETAMPQQHCFLASELALIAEAKARRLGNLA